MPKLRANFEADLIAQVRQNLDVMWGLQYTKNIDDRDVLSYYFDSLRRRIIPRPRKIKIADTFQCPLPCQNGWKVLQTKVASGDDIGPHLSKPHASLFNRDGLLNEWGIHHFHLGTQPDSNDTRYVERTGAVIFAYVTDDIFYAVNVYEHNQQPFESESIIESLHRNWPEVISRYQLRGIKGENLTDEQRRALRAKNAQAAVTMIDGTVYGSIGGPVSGAGTKFESVKQADILTYEVRNLQGGLENELHTLIPYLQQGGYAGEEEVRAELKLTANGYQALFPDYHVLATLTIKQN